VQSPTLVKEFMEEIKKKNRLAATGVSDTSLPDMVTPQVPEISEPDKQARRKKRKRE
jgi:hypothetical protein